MILFSMYFKRKEKIYDKKKITDLLLIHTVLIISFSSDQNISTATCHFIYLLEISTKYHSMAERRLNSSQIVSGISKFELSS